MSQDAYFQNNKPKSKETTRQIIQEDILKTRMRLPQVIEQETLRNMKTKI